MTWQCGHVHWFKKKQTHLSLSFISQFSHSIKILCRLALLAQVLHFIHINEYALHHLFSFFKAYQVFSCPAFSQMVINFFYGGKLIQNTVVNHPEGCRISPQQPFGRSALYRSDSMQSVHFPTADLIEYDRQRHVTRKLLGHLERGVLIRANQEGIFVKRLCQSRVFWCGLGEMGSQFSTMPGKLERDAVVKIFDTGRFLQGEPLCLFKKYKKCLNSVHKTSNMVLENWKLS